MMKRDARSRTPGGCSLVALWCLACVPGSTQSPAGEIRPGPAHSRVDAASTPTPEQVVAPETLPPNKNVSTQEIPSDGPGAPAEQPEDAPPVEPVDPLLAFRTLPPRCSNDIGHCASIHLHIVVTEEGPIQTPEWVRDQIVQVHRHFAPIDVQMQIDAVSALPADQESIDNRSQRDALGNSRFHRGVAHVFVVGRLVNVDEPGEIYGVHWRLRSDRKKRWVILSKISSDRVLTHELGHFFGLPHSSEPISLMNKTPRIEPPYEERTFSHKEHKRMRRHRDRMFADGMLVDPRTSKAD